MQLQGGASSQTQFQERFGLTFCFCRLLAYLLAEQRSAAESLLQTASKRRELVLDALQNLLTDFAALFDHAQAGFAALREFEQIDNQLFPFNEQAIRRQQFEH